jgi:hypothetical protein
MPLTQQQFESAQKAGFSTEQIIAFEKERNTTAPEPSIASQGLGYVGQHPYKAMADVAFNSPVKVITGKNPSEYLDKAVGMKPYEAASMYGNNPIINAGAIAQGTMNDLAGQAADMVTPFNMFGGKVIDAVGKIPAVSKVMNYPLENIPQNLGRYFSRIKTRLNPQAIDNINVSSGQRISNLGKESSQLAQQDIGGIKKDITGINQSTQQQTQNITYQKQDLQKQLTSSVNESRSVLKKNLQNLSGDLQTAAENGSIEFQKKLPDFFHANSEAYSTRLDEAGDLMAKRGDNITRTDMFKIAGQTLNDMREALIPEGSGSQAIKALQEKYAPVSGAVRSNAMDSVPLREALQDLRNVRANLSASAAAGRTGFTQEDLGVQFLNNNLGGFIKTKSPEFAKLQKDYQPVIQAMKEAHKIFKPNQSEFNTATATGFLKKAGMGKLEAGQEKLLSTLEQGSSFSPGVGNLSTPVKQVGSKIQSTIAESATQREQTMVSLKKQMDALEMQKRNIKGSSQQAIIQRKAAIETRQAALKKRLVELDNRRQEVIRLTANKENAKRLKIAIGSAIGGLGSVGYIGKKILSH